MRAIFLILFFLSLITSSGQSKCRCAIFDNQAQDYVHFLSDSIKIFQYTKGLKTSLNQVCVFQALDIEFRYYFSQKLNNQAFIRIEEQENIIEAINCNDTLLNQLYINKANYYMLINDLENLSDFAFKALHESERLNNKNIELRSLKAVIYLFMRLDRDAENWVYIKRARDLILRLNDNKNKASEYIWLAYEFENQYLETGRTSLIDSSLIYAKAAKINAKKYSLNRELAQSFRAHEAVAYHKGEPKNALKHIDSGIYYGKLTKGVFNLSPFYIAKAWDLVDLGRLNDASKCIDTSLAVDNKRDLGFSANVWYEAKEVYGITGDTAKAYNSYKTYTKLKDSILTIERIKSANEVEAKYKSQLKDSKIKNLTFLLIIAITITLTSFLFFNIIRLRKARAKDKAIKKAYEKQVILEKELTNVRNNIAKDFHDDLGNKLAKITVLSDLMTVKDKSKVELKKALNTIKLDANELFRDTKDFMFSLKSESDNLEEIVTYLTDFGTEFFNDLDIDFSLNTNIVQSIKLPSYWNRQVILIFKEAMTNAAKHSKCSEVILEFNYSNQVLHINLKDNGIGFNYNINAKRGLLNMKQRAISIKAKLIITSKPNSTIVQLKYLLPKTGSSIV